MSRLNHVLPPDLQQEVQAVAAQLHVEPTEGWLEPVLTPTEQWVYLTAMRLGLDELRRRASKGEVTA